MTPAPTLLTQAFLVLTCCLTSLQSLHCHKTRFSRKSGVNDVLLLATEGPDRSEPDPVPFDATAARLVDYRAGSPVSGRKPGESPSIVSFCPDKCSCDFTNETNQLRVVCHGHFTENLPLAQLRSDVEILKIQPTTCARDGPEGSCQIVVENHLTLGPIYKRLRLLKSLVITHSNIPNIGRRTMWGLSGLTLLDLSHNKLTNVVDQNFEGLYSLKNLHLDNNLIKSMVSAAFIHIPQLEVLSLRNNRIEELATRIFYKLRNLRSLDLSGNYLQHINGNIFADVPNLEVLKCKGCALFQLLLPDNTYLKRLRELDLGMNSIHAFTDIHQALFTRLSKLDLSDNKLSRLTSRTFSDSRRLNSLDLSGNNLTNSVGDCALCNTSLHYLSLERNKISQLNHRMFDWNTRSLYTLSLSGNFLQAASSKGGLPQLLEKLPNLENIDLSNCHLVQVPKSMFDSNPRLKSINVSDNYLISVDVGSLSHLTWLESLDLSSNYFMDLPKDFFDMVSGKERLNELYLQKNRFVCDKCHILPLLDWLENNHQYWGSCSPRSNPLCLKCSMPNQLLNTPIEDLERDNLPDCVTSSAYDHSNMMPTGIEGRISPEMFGFEDYGGSVIEGYNGKVASRPDLGGRSEGVGDMAWPLSSPYFAMGLVLVIVLIFGLAVFTRYRYYGVYLTHEDSREIFNNGSNETCNSADAADPVDLLNNPVVVLDKNTDSYVNLRYPIEPMHATTISSNGRI